MRLPKIAKTLLLFTICFFFILSLLIFQLNLTVNKSVFSDEYFNRTFEKHITPDDMKSIIKNVLTTDERTLITEKQQTIDNYKGMLEESIDIEWLNTEAPDMINGFFDYLTSDNESMPALNIKSIKSTFINEYVNSIITSKQISEVELGKTFDRLEAAYGNIVTDGKINENVIGELLNIDPFKELGFSRVLIESILIQTADWKQKGISEHELLEIVVTAYVDEKVGVSQMQEELDFNQLFNVMYGSNQNPVKNTREMVDGLRSRLHKVNLPLTLLLLLILAVATYSLKKSLRWIGSCLMIAGMLGLLTFLVGSVAGPHALNNLTGKLGEPKAFDVNSVQPWIKAYFQGILHYILIDGLLIFGVGLILMVVSFFVTRKTVAAAEVQPPVPEPGKFSDRRKGIMVFARVFIILASFTAIICITITFTLGIHSDIDAFKKNNEVIKYQTAKVTSYEALDEVLNTSLFGMISGD